MEAQTTKELGGKQPNMLIIGCDYHRCFQQMFVDPETGELGEPRLGHPGEVKQFYVEFKQRNLAVWVGMESIVDARFGRGYGNEDRSAGCAVVVAVDYGGSLSADLAAGRGQSRSAATIVGPASTGPDVHAGDELAARCASERRPAAQLHERRSDAE